MIIIYFDDKYSNDNYLSCVDLEIHDFQENTNGIFILSNSFDSFKYIIKYISNNNEDKAQFCLITNGRQFIELMRIITENNFLQFIQKACIYCGIKEKYLHLRNEYEILENICTIPEEVINFIRNNSLETNIIYSSSKIITFNSYNNRYYQVHELISKYYGEANSNLFKEFFSLFQEELNQNKYSSILFQSQDDIFDGFKKFDKENIFQFLINLFKEEKFNVIREYTNDSIYPYINFWLLNLEEWLQNINNVSNSLYYNKNAYIISHLMYKLNKYGKKK